MVRSEHVHREGIGVGPNRSVTKVAEEVQFLIAAVGSTQRQLVGYDTEGCAIVEGAGLQLRKSTEGKGNAHKQDLRHKSVPRLAAGTAQRLANGLSRKARPWEQQVMEVVDGQLKM